MAIYIYGLMRTEDGVEAVEARPEARLALVEHGGVCALINDVGDGDLTLRRESALAHTDTIRAAFEHGPILPMRFGTVLPDAVALEAEVLMPRATALRARLEVLDGLAEMQVKASYLEEPLLRSILDSDPRLTKAAARIQTLPPAATHFDRINLGESIHREVEARREADSLRMVEELRSLAEAVSIREPRNERGVLNASFLVARPRLQEFDGAVARLSEAEAAHMQFRLIGPMPPHSFAEGPWDSAVPAGGSTWD